MQTGVFRNQELTLHSRERQWGGISTATTTKNKFIVSSAVRLLPILSVISLLVILDKNPSSLDIRPSTKSPFAIALRGRSSVA